MENAFFLGLPLPIWGFVCFILSAVCIFVWPKTRASASSLPMKTHYVLRWFQSLGWVLFAMASFIEARYKILAIVFLALGIIVYLMFLVTFFRNKPPAKVEAPAAENLGVVNPQKPEQM